VTGGKLRSAVAANIASVASVLLIQIAQVPVLIHVLGAGAYGQYLLLVALPMYLSLSDLGLVAAGSTALTMSVARDDGEKRPILATMWTGVLAVGGLVLALGTGVALLVALPDDYFSVSEGRLVVILFMSYVVLLLMSNLYEAVLRASGFFVQGTLLMAAGRVVDFLCGIVCVVVFGSPVHLVAGFIGGRILWLGVLRWRARRVAPWSRNLPRRWHGPIARRLARPAAASFALPVGNALLNQGIVLVVGVVLGPLAVVTLTAVRTVANSYRQLVNAVSNAVLPVLTVEAATGQGARARAIVRRSVLVTAAAGGVATAGLAFVGPSVIEVWTGGAVTVAGVVLFWFGLAVALDSVWLLMSTLSVSVNSHGGIAVWFLCSAAGMVAGCMVLLDEDSSLVSVGVIACVQSVVMIAAVAHSQRTGRRGSARPTARDSADEGAVPA
jgi:O-antigen/teichoic acid export membrane protein